MTYVSCGRAQQGYIAALYDLFLCSEKLYRVIPVFYVFQPINSRSHIFNILATRGKVHFPPPGSNCFHFMQMQYENQICSA